MTEHRPSDQRSRWDSHTKECAATKAREDGMQNWPSACDCQRTSNPLLERLRRYAESQPHDRGGRALCGEAADEIERLTAILKYARAPGKSIAPYVAEIERLRAELDNERSAMRNVQECAESYRRERDAFRTEFLDVHGIGCTQLKEDNERLRAALHEARHVMRWEMGYQDGGRNIANADKVCAKIDSLIGVADETKP